MKIYTNCSCVPAPPVTVRNVTQDGGFATGGPCAVDCKHKFYLFLAVICLLQFSGATGRASNFLVAIRCVKEVDKTVSMALGITIVGLFAFIPSPLLFGYIIGNNENLLSYVLHDYVNLWRHPPFSDKTCIVWGKTCTGTGNCWFYNTEAFRYFLNFTAAGKFWQLRVNFFLLASLIIFFIGFVIIGTFFDVGVWYFVKHLKIFDDDIELSAISSNSNDAGNK